MKNLFIILLFISGSVSSQTTKVSGLYILDPLSAVYQKTVADTLFYNVTFRQSLLDSIRNAVSVNNTQTSQINGQATQIAATQVNVAKNTADITALQQGGSTPTALSPNIQSSATYTIKSTDRERVIVFTSNSPITCTIPAGLVSGFNTRVVQAGTGTVTLRGSLTVLTNINSYFRTNKKNADVEIENTLSETYNLVGNLKL